jgi:gliding motility-associated-like protein
MTAGPHKVTAHDQYGCDTTFTIVVGQPAAAVVQIVPDDTTIAGGASVQLVSTFGPYPADSTRSYVWTPATGLNCTDCTSPLANPYTSTTYTLALTYNAGCIVTATAQINVNGHPPLYVPNAFSPNGDGVNDVWSIFGTGIKDVKSMIFNRWGEKVFETDDQFQSWDGVYRGERQPTGVYVYLVDVVYLDGETDTRKGSVTLIR